VVEEDVLLGLLDGDFAGPVGEAEPTEGMVRRARRDGVGLATSGFDRLERRRPAVANADVEPGVIRPGRRRP